MNAETSIIDPANVVMSAVSFAGTIRSQAAEAGRDPTSEQIAGLEDQLRAAAFFDADGKVVARNESGTVTIAQFIGRRMSSMRRAASPQSDSNAVITNVTGPS